MKPIAITVGDPAGIGPEILAKAVAEFSTTPLVLIGDLPLTRSALALCGVDFPWPVHDGVDLSALKGPVFVSTRSTAASALQIGVANAASGKAALDAIEFAAELAETGRVSAVVTAPISKTAIKLAGSSFPGHTELLAARAGLRQYGRDFAMLFDSPRLRVALLSVHVSLREALELIDAETILNLGTLLDREVPRISGRKPRIAVAGLNPHAGEEGRFGGEEEVIQAGVRMLRESGVLAEGPFAPDTVFLNALDHAYDVVIAMYHDQGLIPVKTMDFEHSVNVTVGLPYLRVSVDHGTAFDIAGRGVANAAPMKYAIDWAIRNQRGWSG